MIVLHQAVEQRLIGGAAHLLNPDGDQLLQWPLHRRGIDQHRLGPRTSRSALASNLPAHGRQLDLPGTLQHQQQAATDYVAQCSVGLFPTQGFA
jgi:hypothetical protein